MAGFERDKRTTQDGKIAVEIEVFGARGVLFKQGVPNPMVADFATSPVTANQPREPGCRLPDKTGKVVTDGFHALFACVRTGGPGVLGDDHQAAHVRQSAGDGFDRIDLDFAVFYPTVSTILCVAGKRGEPVAAMRCASVMAVGWLPLSWKRKSPSFSMTSCIFSRSQ